MKRKFHRFCMLLVIHCVFSFAVLGAVRVWQKGYNKTHREQLQMASVAINDDQAEISILGRSMILSLEAFQEDSMLYYGLYVVSDGFVKSWLWIVHEIVTIIS